MNSDIDKVLCITTDQLNFNPLNILLDIYSKESLLFSNNVNEAIDLLKMNKADLILLDFDSERKNNFSSIYELKSDEHSRNVPIVLYLSSTANKDQLQQAADAGINAFIHHSMDDIQIATLFQTLINQTREICKTDHLQKQVEIFNQFSIHSPIFMFIKEVSPTESRVLQSSENFIDMIGIPGSQMVGKTMEELFPLEFARKITRDDWDVVSKGEVFQQEEVFNNCTYLTIKFPIKQGIRTLLAGYTIDINEQKQIEESLRKSEEHFRSIVDNSDAGYFFIDKDGIIQDVNQAWVKLYKYTSVDEILNHHFAEIQKIDDLETAQAFVDGIMRNDEQYLKGEFSRLCKDGSIGYHTFSARPVTKDHEIIGIEGFIIDITEHRLAVEALRASEERYHLIDEASQDMIYSYDQNSRFTHANTYMCQRLELTLEQILGKTHEDLGFPQVQCDEWAVLHQQVYDTDATVIAETTAPIPDGTIVNYEVVLNPMHDAHGKIIGIAGTTRNIHGRKLAEAKIKEQMLELQQWHTITMGREDRILELKREVNQLLEEAGKPPRYKSVGNENTLSR